MLQGLLPRDRLLELSSHLEKIHDRTTDLELNSSAFPFRQNSLSSAISTTSLNRTLASAFMKAT